MMDKTKKSIVNKMNHKAKNPLFTSLFKKSTIKINSLFNFRFKRLKNQPQLL
jgi:hypothetical protein